MKTTFSPVTCFQTGLSVLSGARVRLVADCTKALPPLLIPHFPSIGLLGNSVAGTARCLSSTCTFKYGSDVAADWW